MLANKLYIADYMKNYHQEIANLLENGLEVNLYLKCKKLRTQFLLYPKHRFWSMLEMLITFVTGLETKSGSKLWNGRAKKVSMQQRTNLGPWPQVSTRQGKWEFHSKASRHWYSGETAGRLRTYQNFQFLQVYFIYLLLFIFITVIWSRSMMLVTWCRWTNPRLQVRCSTLGWKELWVGVESVALT